MLIITSFPDQSWQPNIGPVLDGGDVNCCVTKLAYMSVNDVKCAAVHVLCDSAACLASGVIVLCKVDVVSSP